MNSSKIPLRTNRIVNFFLISFFLILIRIWYLCVIQHDQHLEQSLKPQRRTVIERLERATIRDRFNLPLAVNQIQYNAAICYGDIRQIPSYRFEKDEKGKTRRVMARRQYIEELSHFLASALEMDSQSIEDMINGKASLFPHTPFVLKEDISEALYYKLKMKEKDWMGIQMQQSAKRFYPYGKVGCDVIGYMGAIGPNEYLNIAQEIRKLQTYLSEREEGKPVILPKGFSSPEAVEKRLVDLQERAYTINAHVGKSGVEASFDEVLRGTYGKKIYEVDIKGNTLSQLPEVKGATSGKRLFLSISAELQEEAEKILSEYEAFQDARDQANPKKRRSPWLRGGAIVAMHPKTGEVLALASYPRFDPNDLVPAQSFEKRLEKRSSVIQWLESEAHIGEIWDGKRPMQRERFSSLKNSFFTEELPLTWENYLSVILPSTSPVHKSLDAVSSVTEAIHLQKCYEISPDHPDLEPYLGPIEYSRDKHLFIDLLRMTINGDSFTPSLLEYTQEQSLSEFRALCQEVACYLSTLKENALEEFRAGPFKQWREAHFKTFMIEKRKEEKKHKRYARPFIEYLEMQQHSLFADFWEKNRWEILHTFVMQRDQLPFLKEFLEPLSKSERIAYLKALRNFEELNRPLIGKYPMLRSSNQEQLEKHLAAAFYPYTGFGYGRSQAFRQASPMGSIFKVIPAYAGLKHQYEKGTENLNPLTIIDSMQWTSTPGSNSQVLGYFENGKPIKRLYKGGRLPRAYPNIGKIDVIGALERSSNIYFSLLAGDILESPRSLLDAASSFGIGSKTGLDLPGEYQGHLPDDLMHNKTGLYSFAMGQHSLVVTPLQTASMLCTIANGGELLKPQIVKLSADKEGNISYHTPEVKDTLFLPPEVRTHLLKGMRQVVNGERGSARLNIMRAPFYAKTMLENYRKLRPQMVGKTGTAEILYKQTIDAATEAEMEKHVWFGAISFEDKYMEEPDLVVVVYLRFGSVGRQGAPIAAQMIERWRQIKALH